ncbi:MAG: hypothetical protein JW982_02210, partial [Spirochaetes bacterium]|nr:hypothetical protein [Spirochaetota bacterium]
LNTGLFDNYPEFERKAKAEEYLKDIFKSAGVNYDNPDKDGLYYAVEILASRSLLEGEESKSIIKKLKCFNETS